MLDILSLERRWRKYKIKSYLPHFIISIATIAILIGISIIFISSKNTVKKVETIKPSVIQKSIPKDLHDNDMILEPSMQFIESISPNIQPPQAINAQPKSLPVKSVIEPKVPNFVTSGQLVKTNPPSVPIAPPPSIVRPKVPTMKHDSNAFDIHEIEERFKVNSNPHLGLYIARYHYEHANYTEAYNYALKTNSINSTIEESWLIFAKSLVKLGKNDQAKKTLQLYISQSNSDSAKSLLYSIEQGGIK